MFKTHNYYLQKSNRILMWVTLPLLIFHVITGYGSVNPQVISELTGGVLTRSLSLNLHRTFDVPVLVLLTFHILVQLRFTLMRWRVKDGLILNAFIVMLGVFFIVLILLMDGTL